MKSRLIAILKILLDIDDIEIIKCVIESLIEELGDNDSSIDKGD